MTASILVTTAFALGACAPDTAVSDANLGDEFGAPATATKETPPPTPSNRPSNPRDLVTEFARRWANDRPYGDLADLTMNALANDVLAEFRGFGATEIGTDIGWDARVDNCTVTVGVTDTCEVLLVNPKELAESVDSPSVWVTFAHFDASEGYTSCHMAPEVICTTGQKPADPDNVRPIVVGMSRKAPDVP